MRVSTRDLVIFVIAVVVGTTVGFFAVKGQIESEVTAKVNAAQTKNYNLQATANKATATQLFKTCLVRQSGTDLSNTRAVALHLFLLQAATARKGQGLLEEQSSLGHLQGSRDVATGLYWAKVLAPVVIPSPRIDCRGPAALIGKAHYRNSAPPKPLPKLQLPG